MYQNLKHRFGVSLLSGLICLTAISAFACSVPVFRYALEKWSADPYQMVIFYKGKLDEEMKELLTASIESAEESHANLKITPVDLDGSPTEEMLKLYKSEGERLTSGHTIPHAVVLNPNPNPQIIWSGFPSKKVVQNLTDSPLRQQIIKQLLKGETAVWVLLEGKDKAENDVAFQTLTKELAHLEKTLKLPEIEEEDKSELTGDAAELRISFPLVRLSKKNAEEALFIEMLLSVEDDLRNKEFKDKPMAFPIFGRGRALYALIGKGITKETITGACHFMVGSCSCEIKEQNPGTDMLMTVDWEKNIEELYQVDTSSPPLTGITSMVGTTTQSIIKSPTDTKTSAPFQKQTDNTSLSTPAEESGSLIRNTMIFLGLCVMLVIGMSVFLVNRNG